MMTTSLAMAWLQLLALLAAEVALIALVVALLRRGSASAAWSRTFCQAGIVAVLVLTACELSGSARVLGGWAASTLAWRHGAQLPGRSATPGNPPAAPAIADSSAFAGAQRFSGFLPPSRPEMFPPRPAAGRRTFSSHPGPAVPRSLDTVADSMRVLWLCLVWATGAVLVGARACLAQCLFVIFPLRRRPAGAPAVVDRVQALARALGMRRAVRVVESVRLSSPIAFGLIRPTVGLPPDFAGRFDSAKQEAILAHELAHLAGHDPFWCLVADGAAAVLWWHPGVWWLRRQLHLASEMAADEASLLVADGPRVLAECLVELAARLTRPLRFSHLRVSGFRSHLGLRVHRLVHLESRAWSPPSPLRATLTRILGPVAITAIVVLCTAWAVPQASTKGDSMKSMQLNWKRSLAAFALLAAFNGPEAPVAVAQTNQPEARPAPTPELAPVARPAPALPDARPEASEAPAPPQPPPTPPAVPADPFAPPSGIPEQPAAQATEGIETRQAQAMEAFRRRYGMFAPPGLRSPDRRARPTEKPPHGAKLEAKLKQIVLPEIAFDDLPLSEVLRVLSNESLKRDPDKTGVNFLINPNLRPAPGPGAVDPTTGLLLGVPREQFDPASVAVKFNLPLRNVTLKDVLDAIVIVADHPIEYTVEDFAVVFSAKPEPMAGPPILLPRPEMAPVPPQAPRSRNAPGPMPALPGNAYGSRPESPGQTQNLNAELADVKPQTFNIDFGPSDPSQQVGAAAAGRAGDFWNTVAVLFNDHHTAGDLKFAGGDPSPIEVEMLNLGGSWGAEGVLGVKSPMLDDFDYPTGNKGGNAEVILRQVPPGKYNVFIYGHGTMPGYYGDYTLTVGTHDHGRKQTSHGMDAIRNTKWVEGSQYVKFSGVKVGPGDEVDVLIRPGAQVTDSSGRTFADAMICGLQLVPVK